MIELIPNCSEIICRIDLDQLDILEENGYSVVGKKDLKDSWNSDLHLMTPKGEKIRFVEKDDLACSDVIMCGDYDRECYPILKEVSELIGEEIMGHDGGGTYAYEEWLEEQEKKNKKKKPKEVEFEMIPNCSEYVSRIDLSSDEIVRLRKVLKLMSPDLCWDYFEEYLKGTDGDTIFMGEEERDAIEEALELIGKRSEKDE